MFSIAPLREAGSGLLISDPGRSGLSACVPWVQAEIAARIELRVSRGVYDSRFSPVSTGANIPRE